MGRDQLGRFNSEATPPEQRFWKYVGPHGDPDTCWIWAGSTISNHNKIPMVYGQFSITKSQKVLAHRYAYELLVGPIPEGMTLDHVKSRGCTNTLCVNPAHLEPVTQRENVLRGIGIPAVNIRKTHCKRGHLFDRENTYVYPPSSKRSGRRRCNTCFRVLQANYRSRHKLVQVSA